jgi:hypothetical protein
MKSFHEWKLVREQSIQNELPAGYDPFTTMQQKAGDVAYFGVHDLSKFYRSNKVLPQLNDNEIQSKSGEVVTADPVKQTISVAVTKAPYHFGYHKLENKESRSNRKLDDLGRMLVTLPVAHLQDITHMFPGTSPGRVWLVIDGNTKYQQNLMQAVRRSEIQKAHGTPAPVQSNMAPAQVQQTPARTDGYVPRYQMQGREVTPIPLQTANFDPSILSYDRFWKTHNDCKRYDYFAG